MKCPVCETQHWTTPLKCMTKAIRNYKKNQIYAWKIVQKLNKYIKQFNKTNYTKLYDLFARSGD